MRYTLVEMQKRKIKRRGDRYFQRRFQRKIYYGKKEFAFFKRNACEMLKIAAKYWTENKPLLTKKDYEHRKFFYSYTELAVTMYNRVKEGLRFRKSYKFRDCVYKKYTDLDNKRITFDLQYFRVINKVHFHKCLTLYYKKSPLFVYKAELSDALPNISSLPFAEFGSFRYSPTDTGVFNIYFYHKNSGKYAYNFISKSADVYKVKPIDIKVKQNIGR